MKSTFPIITCDSEDGCDQWTLDWYEAEASNWRDLMANGWQYDPHRGDVPHLCPRHRAPDASSDTMPELEVALDAPSQPGPELEVALDAPSPLG